MNDQLQLTVPVDPPVCKGESPLLEARVKLPDANVAVGELPRIGGKSISRSSNEFGALTIPPGITIDATGLRNEGLAAPGGRR